MSNLLQPNTILENNLKNTTMKILISNRMYQKVLDQRNPTNNSIGPINVTYRIISNEHKHISKLQLLAS